MFVHKIAGAAAEAGKDLQEVKRIAQKTIDKMKSIGIALDSCTVPAKGTPTFKLDDDEIEFGVGIHGEPGIERQKIKSADEMAQQMLDKVLKELDLGEGKDCAVIVNGLGATPLMELYLLNNSISKQLKDKGISTYKTFVGNYMTALDMAGASITVLELDDELKTYLDAPAQTPGFKQ